MSTAAFRGRHITEAIDIAAREQFALEFSSGIPYQPDLNDIYLSANCERYLHNYFPAPQVPFVLNLASLDKSIRDHSNEHCRTGIRLAAQSKSPFFSVHAGICGDPKAENLGSDLQIQTQKSREAHWAVFIESVRELVLTARDSGVVLLIENNVLTVTNLRAKGGNPLFCADPEELRRLINDVQSADLGLLLDTGHWKVSSASLGFAQSRPLLGLESHVHAIHHSDNDGLADTNRPIGGNYWFLSEMPRFSHAVHVLEVNDQPMVEILRQRDLLRRSIQ